MSDEISTNSEEKSIKAFEDSFSVAEKDLVELPAIDMSEPPSKLIPQLIKMLTEVGFLQLKNVPGFDEETLLKDTKEFHSMPAEVKKMGWPNHLNKENKNIYRGWFPFMDNDPSHKEFFDMGLPLREYSHEHKLFPIVEDNPMPKDPKYRSIINRYVKWWHF